MAKRYTGSLTLEWYNKQKSIMLKSTSDPSFESDIPAPKINWINKDEALFYEIDEDEGKGVIPYWVSINDIRVKEARPLKHVKTFIASQKNDDTSLLSLQPIWKIEQSEIDDLTIENILVKGDNLLCLNSLIKLFKSKRDEEKIKCIYIDPPYNIGKAFQYYEDNLEHSEWLTLMRDRLVRLKELLQEGGFIFVQLDDAEGPYGKVLLDEIFGRDNFIVTMYIQVRYDEKTLKEDMVFNKLIEQIHIYRKTSTIKAEINRETIPYTSEKFIWKIIEKKDPDKLITLGGKKVAVFNRDSYEIIDILPSKEGLKEIWASGSILDGNSSGRFFRDYITGRETIDGYGSLYKVYDIGDDGLGYRYFTGPKKIKATRGKYYQGIPQVRKESEEEGRKFIPISNFIDLAAYFGNCRHEGGVDFKSGKKPEILIAKLFEIASSPGDLILDCFGGSGTTFAVAQKMNRKWIGIEIGNHAETHIIKRLQKVISGNDNTAIGPEWGWQGGGSFKYYILGESIIKLKLDGTGDLNWSLGIPFLQESFLQSYDYSVENSYNLFNNSLFDNEEDKPCIGIQTLGQKVRLAVVSLNPPNGNNKIINQVELNYLYENLKKIYSPEYINIFTNRGVDIPLDTKPDDLEIIKIPQAIFAELEK